MVMSRVAEKKEAPTKVEAISPSANPIEFDGIGRL